MSPFSYSLDHAHDAYARMHSLVPFVRPARAGVLSMDMHPFGGPCIAHACMHTWLRAFMAGVYSSGTVALYSGPYIYVHVCMHCRRTRWVSL